MDDVDKRTSAHVRCRDAVRTRGLSPTSAFFQSSTPAKRQPAHDEWQPKGPAVDLHRRRKPGSPRWESTSTARGEKVVTTKKNQSQPLGPWHPPQLRTARPIGPARSATRRSQPWAEPREWVTASRPRHGSRHLKHAPAKKTPLPLFFLSATFPLWAHTCATVAQAGRDDWPLSLCPGPSFGRLSCFLKHSSLTTHRSEAARGWGLVKPGEKASPRWI